MDIKLLNQIVNADLKLLTETYPTNGPFFKGLLNLLDIDFCSLEFFCDCWVKHWYNITNEFEKSILYDLADQSDNTYISGLVSECIFRYEKKYPYVKRACTGYFDTFMSDDYNDEKTVSAFVRLLDLTKRVNHQLEHIDAIVERVKNLFDNFDFSNQYCVTKAMVSIGFFKNDEIIHFLNRFKLKEATWPQLERVKELLDSIPPKICDLLLQEEKKAKYIQIFNSLLDIAQTIPLDSALHLFQKEHILKDALLLCTGQDVKKQELMIQIAEVQKHIPDYLQKFDYQIDITDYISLYSGYLDQLESIEQLFFLLANLPFLNQDEQSTLYKKKSENMVFTRLASIFVTDEKGRTIAKIPSCPSDSDQKNIHAIHQSLDTINMTGCIYWTLFNKYNISEIDLTQFVDLLYDDNLLCDNNRVVLLKTATRYGLNGKLMEALHILIPQLENSLRVLLEKSGIPISHPENDIEECITFDGIIRTMRDCEIFEDNFLFTIETLFVNRAGINARNRLAHGLLIDDWFTSAEAFYTFIIILKIYFLYSGQLQELLSNGIIEKLKDKLIL